MDDQHVVQPTLDEAIDRLCCAAGAKRDDRGLAQDDDSLVAMTHGCRRIALSWWQALIGRMSSSSFMKLNQSIRNFITMFE